MPGRQILGSRKEPAVWLGPHRRLAAACTWRGLGPHDWGLLAGCGPPRLVACAGWWIRWSGQGDIRVTGPWVWLGGGCSPEHFLAVGFPIPGGGSLVGFSFLLHPGELVSDGLDGSYLGIYRLRSTWWLHTLGVGQAELCGESGWSWASKEAYGLW